MKISVLGLSLWSSVLLAGAPPKTTHREQHAHVHGSAQLMMAFDGTEGKLEFKSPADSVLGFEHAAKTAADQKAVQDLKTQFENQISQMVQMDSNLKCTFSKQKVELDVEGKHADFEAEFRIACGTSPVGSSVTIDFTRFAKLKDLDVTILAGDLQKTGEAKQKPLKIDLKP